MTDTPPKKRSLVGKLLLGVLLTFLVLFISASMGGLPLEFGSLILFGWVNYLVGVLPRVSFNGEIFVAAVITLTLATGGLHGVLVWWTLARLGENGRWPFRSTLKVVVMTLMLFATSIAATGIVHQLGWLARGKVVTTNRSWTTRDLAQLKSVFPALLMYEGDNDGKLPRDIEEIVPDYLPIREYLYVAVDRSEPPERCLYFPDHQGKDPSKTIILAGPAPYSSGTRIVVYRDGSAMRIKEEEYQKLLRDQSQPSAGPP